MSKVIKSAILVMMILGLQDYAFLNSAEASPISNPQGRIKYTLNDHWMFLPEGCADAYKADHDDSGWTVVDVPHTWNAYDPFDDKPGYIRGISWYRKNMYLSNELNGKQIFLYFEGVHQIADVYVNGKPAGRHKGGYTAFSFDVTGLIKFDGKNNCNSLALRVDNSHDPMIPPLSIGYAHYGGIYRDVWLIATDPVHIELLDYASPGIYIETPNVSEEKANVSIRGTLVNDSSELKKVEIISTIIDSDNKTVATTDAILSVRPGQHKEFKHSSIKIIEPNLWSPDNPYLYKVKTVVYDGKDPVDEVENYLGIRWFNFDPEKGFFLNGQSLKLRGTNRHQDYKDRGSAVPNWVHRRDLELIKDMGANFLRLAHYPQDPVVLDTADKLGLIIWEEIPVVNYITVSDEFTENCKTMLTEMIRQHYNHPSVVLWGLMNEVFLHSQEGERTKSFEGKEAYVKAVTEFTQQLDNHCRQEDSTRVSTMALHGDNIYNECGSADIPQVIGWNLYHGWYFGNFNSFGPFLDKQHEKYPKRCITISEYGGGSDSRLHSLNPQRFDFTCEWQRLYHESHIRQIEERPYLAATAIWNQFDFSQPRAGESIPHVNQKGMLTFDRKLKDVYFLYKANLSKDPVLYIASREWLRRTGTNPDAIWGVGKQTVNQPVQVYSNLQKVELLLNDNSLGSKEPDDVHSAIWDVPFEDGWNIIKAKGMNGDQQMDDRVEIFFTYRAPSLADTSVPFKELAVNVGSNAQFIDEDNLIWEADQEYTLGGWGYVKGTPRQYSGSNRKSLEIFGTDEDPLYQTFLQGVESYKFDVPDGNYEIEIRLADYPLDKIGMRVFNVDVNGTRAFENLDLVKDYGVRRAVDRVIQTQAVGSKGVEIVFEPVEGESILSAVRIKKL